MLVIKIPLLMIDIVIIEHPKVMRTRKLWVVSNTIDSGSFFVVFGKE